MARIKWKEVVRHAAKIVDSYDSMITLRQLFYRLVSDGTLPNTQNNYNHLSKVTAKARREDGFPALEDRNRGIWRPASWDGAENALAALRAQYRRDRTEGQPVQLLVGVEKDALSGMFKDWLREYGIPLLVLKGYASQTFKDEVARYVHADERETVLLFAGDFDPSGLDLHKDFVNGVGLIDHVERIAVTQEQIDEFELPEHAGKKTDPRAKGFVEKYDKLVQVELDALPPEELQRIVLDAVRVEWDQEVYEAVMAQEAEERMAI